MNKTDEIYIVNNDIHIHTFFRQVEYYSESEINLEHVSKNFPLDVYLEKDTDYTVSLNGFNSKVLKQCDTHEVLTKPTKLSSTRTKNKLSQFNIPKGFTKLIYPDTSYSLKYSNPPEFIPIGAYCIVCNSFGPDTHLPECRNPSKNSLYLTFQGLIDNVYILNTDYSKYIIKIITKDPLQKDPQKIIKLLPNRYLKKILVEINEGIRSSNKIKTTIPVTFIYPLYKKENRKYFEGPLLITFTTSNNKTSTIRLFNNGSISFISNPWTDQNLYISFISKLNSILDNKIGVGSTSIKSLFASVNILNYNIPDIGLKHFDIKNLFAKLQEIKYIPQIIDNVTYYYIKHKNNIYRIILKSDAISKNRIYLTFINANTNVSTNTNVSNSKIVSGPYKITCIIFAQGHLQFNFCYCDSKDNVDNVLCDSDTDTSDTNIIEMFINDIKDLLINNILTIMKTSVVLVDAPIKKVSDKIYPTILGILPYAKRKKFKIGDFVHVFDDSTMEWGTTGALVVDTITKFNGIEEYIEYHVRDPDTQSIMVLEHRNLRRHDQNNDQVCRVKDSGVCKLPVPYSFFGRCFSGLSYYIPPYGVCSRSDNKFYPYCEQLIDDSEKWILNWLLNGYSEYELKKHHILLKNIAEDNYDKYTGILNYDSTQINAIINAYINGTLQQAKIIDKYKTHGLGNDNNRVYYKVQLVDSELDTEYTILGNDFHESYIETRYFAGIYNLGLSLEQITSKLIKCFDELDLLEAQAHVLGSQTQAQMQTQVLLNSFNMKYLKGSRYSMFLSKKTSRISLIINNSIVEAFVTNGDVVVYYYDSNYNNKTTVKNFIGNNFCIYFIEDISIKSPIEYIKINFNKLIATNDLYFFTDSTIYKYVHQYNKVLCLKVLDATSVSPSTVSVGITNNILITDIKLESSDQNSSLSSGQNSSLSSDPNSSLSSDQNSGPKFIKLKLNKMLDNNFYLNKIYKPIISSEEHYTGDYETLNQYYTITNPIKYSMFLTGDWYYTDNCVIHKLKYSNKFY